MMCDANTMILWEKYIQSPRFPGVPLLVFVLEKGTEVLTWVRVFLTYDAVHVGIRSVALNANLCK